MAYFNPYSLLNIPESADSQEIEQAYLNIIAKYDAVKKLSPKQKQKLDEIQKAYDMLSNSTSKEILDYQITQGKNHNTYAYIKDEVLDTEPESEQDELKEPSKDKYVFKPKDKKSSSIFSTLLLMAVVIIGPLKLYEALKNNPDTEPQEETLQDSTQTSQALDDIPVQPLITEDYQNINQNFPYPDPSYLSQEQIIYAPNGSPFPLQPTVLEELSTYEDGPSTILVQNPRNSAIFGKVIVKYNQASIPSVIRYFYIPSQDSLMLFGMPSATYQIQIITLNKPVAFASPIFTIPLGSAQSITQVANWQYPYRPQLLF